MTSLDLSKKDGKRGKTRKIIVGQNFGSILTECILVYDYARNVVFEGLHINALVRQPRFEHVCLLAAPMRSRFRPTRVEDLVAIGHRLVLLKESWRLVPPVDLMSYSSLHAPHLVHTLVQLPTHLRIRLRVETGRELLAALGNPGRPYSIHSLVSVETGISLTATWTGARHKRV